MLERCSNLLKRSKAFKSSSRSVRKCSSRLFKKFVQKVFKLLEKFKNVHKVGKTWRYLKKNSSNNVVQKSRNKF